MVENLEGLLAKCEEVGSLTIFDSFIKSAPKLKTYRKIVCAVSGGADSDIMLDIFARLDREGKVKYIFFDTGIEYEATKKHLVFLEQKYGIKIERVRATVPVPLGCRKYGVPFWSKYVSDMMYRLQSHGFKWEDRPFDELYKEYPKCKIALKWWCNVNSDVKGKVSRFNIAHVPRLKEYIVKNPPTFKISNKCCNGAKKNVSKKYLDENAADLYLLGLRKAEGGIRGTTYKSCFSPAKDKEDWDNYRPIFWYTDKDKEEYESLFAVTHSACYTQYGLKRTGCAGCPFGKRFEEEIEICREHEPKLFKAINNIFGESYAYTRGFLKFREEMKENVALCVAESH